ncbi:MAG: T9SS type A sorting domain-containing protein [Bacteroidetes bacterium]|nr:T9SS type A sorting domain-containing protein [Bacteroidota bacterium]
MTKILMFILLISVQAYSQPDISGKFNFYSNENGSYKVKTILIPQINPDISGIKNESLDNNYNVGSVQNNTNVRWSFTDPASIGNNCDISGNGKYNVTDWNLNNNRISLYGNSNSVPLWEFPSDPNSYINYTSISDTGGVIAVGSYHNIYLFRNNSGVPFFNFDLTQLEDTGIASALDITSDGSFLVSSVSRNDSSTIFGFNANSSTPVWKVRLRPTQTTGGGSVQGLKLSGNDSLFIVNTYSEFYVMNTYTGQIIYNGLINPGLPSNGTQSAQGISGDGSVIATINYSGNLRCYQRSGSTYTFLWQHEEPPGQFYNWMTCVDITYDGNYIAAGTLNFISSSSFDGKIKLIKRSGIGIPDWTFTGAGDEITALSFSRSGNILSASSWGDLNGASEDLYIFKSFLGNIPVFKLNTAGSLFDCRTSADGRTVTACGKAVHARQFGNGGILYNIDVDTSDTPTGIFNSSASIADEFRLYQNFPNPFNPVTNISFEIRSAEFTELKIFDLLGNEVKSLLKKYLQPGTYTEKFDASGIPSGIYFYRLTAGNFSETKKLTLIK